MLDPDDLHESLQKWIEKADHDLDAAVRILRAGRNPPTDAVCFHAQQCIEKYLKALLTLRRVVFPKTHDLEALMTLLAKNDRPVLDETTQERLTDYATVTRYPDLAADPTVAEARKALAVARRVRREVRRLMPRTAFRRKN